MKKIELKQLSFGRHPKLISEGEYTKTYSLPSGVLKLFHSGFLDLLKMNIVDMEQKILHSNDISLPKEIIRPIDAVYCDGRFVGYTMQRAKGIDYNTIDDQFTLQERCDLYQYADIYSKLERIIRSTPDIIYPDLCTCDNIYVNHGNIQLIDYDGFQVGKYASPGMSTTLGDPLQYIMSKKYTTDKKLFTKELDKKSLMFFYFLSAFNIKLCSVGQIDPSTGRKVTLDDMFKFIQLDDLDIQHKVWKLFNERVENEYLGDDVYRLAEKYQMSAMPFDIFGKTHYLKKLSRK